MQAIGETAARHCAAREFVNNHHLPFLNNVVNITLEQVMGLEGLQKMVLQGDVLGIVKVLDIQEFFSQAHPVLGKSEGTVFLIQAEMFVRLQVGHNNVHP